MMFYYRTPTTTIDITNVVILHIVEDLIITFYASYHKFRGFFGYKNVLPID